MKSKFISYFMSIFDNHSQGASMRKILAFVTGIIFASWLHYKFVTPDNALNFLMVDLACALLCLGIITMEQVIKFKNGNSTTDDETTTTTLPPTTLPSNVTVVNAAPAVDATTTLPPMDF